MQVLLVKTSSLGDVIHCLPAVTDAALARPGLRFDWLVERAFAEIPRWHPSIERIVTCDLRGWRRAPLKTLRDGTWSQFRQQLRERQYDRIVDAQGLVKSAWLASQARGPLAGPKPARERMARLFYRDSFPVPAYDSAHAVDRARRLFAQALGYPLPNLAATPDFGLVPANFPAPGIDQPFTVFLHGTTWPAKRWPIEHWQALASAMTARGLRVVLPWGSDAERADAEAIASACAGLVLPRLTLAALAGWLAKASLVVGVDTGLMHLAAALGTPGISLYGPTLPQLTGAVGRNQIWLEGEERPTTIDRDRKMAIFPQRVEDAISRLLPATA